MNEATRIERIDASMYGTNGLVKAPNGSTAITIPTSNPPVTHINIQNISPNMMYIYSSFKHSISDIPDYTIGMYMQISIPATGKLSRGFIIEFQNIKGEENAQYPVTIEFTNGSLNWNQSLQPSYSTEQKLPSAVTIVNEPTVHLNDTVNVKLPDGVIPDVNINGKVELDTSVPLRTTVEGTIRAEIDNADAISVKLEGQNEVKVINDAYSPIPVVMPTSPNVKVINDLTSPVPVSYQQSHMSTFSFPLGPSTSLPNSRQLNYNSATKKFILYGFDLEFYFDTPNQKKISYSVTDGFFYDGVTNPIFAGQYEINVHKQHYFANGIYIPDSAIYFTLMISNKDSTDPVKIAGGEVNILFGLENK